jgi:hypothetical protein
LTEGDRELQNANVHEASGSATGYLFQCRALLLGLQAIPNAPELEISIEKFDDIAFEAVGEPIELIQTKHHVGKKGNLSDGSVDLWKTFADMVEPGCQECGSAVSSEVCALDHGRRAESVGGFLSTFAR